MKLNNSLKPYLLVNVMASIISCVYAIYAANHPAGSCGGGQPTLGSNPPNVALLTALAPLLIVLVSLPLICFDIQNKNSTVANLAVVVVGSALYYAGFILYFVIVSGFCG